MYFNDFDNKDNKFRLNRIVFPLRDKRYLTFFSHFRSVLYYLAQDMGATAPKNAMLSVARCNALQWTMQCIAFVIAPHCIKKAIPFRIRSGMAERVKECSKNSEFRFLPFLVSFNGQLSYLAIIFFPFTMWRPFFRPSVVPFSLIIFPSMLYTPLTFVLASSTPAMPVALP